MSYTKVYKRIAAPLVIAVIGTALFLGHSASTAETKKFKPGTKLNANNWTEMTGFKPDLTGLDGIAGTNISKSNAAKYKKYYAKGLGILIDKYKLKLKMKDYKPIHPSIGYMKATEKYAGQPKIIKTGNNTRKRGLQNYTAGLPFPQPKNGLEIAWNYNYSYNGDDGDMRYAVQWVSAARGVEHTEEWRWAFIIRTINRTDIDPIPAIQQFVDKRIQYTSMTYALSPYDKKGFGAVYSRSVDPKDQQGHIYVPAMRRVLRNTFGTRGDTWNSTDLLYEDVRGFMGYPEWMNWKLVAKTTKFGPMNAKAKRGKKNAIKTFDNKNWPYWNPTMNWEPRPTYVVEVTAKFKDYPYKKQIMYIDAETYYIFYKEMYDRKGELWKVLIIGNNASIDEDEHPITMGAGLIVDLQSEHATVLPVYSFQTNKGLDPGMFTLSNLRKRGR